MSFTPNDLRILTAPTLGEALLGSLLLFRASSMARRINFLSLSFMGMQCVPGFGRVESAKAGNAGYVWLGFW